MCDDSRIFKIGFLRFLGLNSKQFIERPLKACLQHVRPFKVF